jgi:hypothetical protein
MLYLLELGLATAALGLLASEVRFLHEALKERVAIGLGDALLGTKRGVERGEDLGKLDELLLAGDDGGLGIKDQTSGARLYAQVSQRDLGGEEGLHVAEDATIEAKADRGFLVELLCDVEGLHASGKLRGDEERAIELELAGLELEQGLGVRGLGLGVGLDDDDREWDVLASGLVVGRKHMEENGEQLVHGIDACDDDVGGLAIDEELGGGVGDELGCVDDASGILIPKGK